MRRTVSKSDRLRGSGSSCRVSATWRVSREAKAPRSSFSFFLNENSNFEKESEGFFVALGVVSSKGSLGLLGETKRMMLKEGRRVEGESLGLVFLKIWRLEGLGDSGSWAGESSAVLFGFMSRL